MTKEEWLFPNAIVPVDVETTAALVAEIKRLIDVVGGMALAQPAQEPVEYQMRILGGRWAHCAKHIYDAADKSTVRALYTTPPQREWADLTDEEIDSVFQISAYQTEPIKRFSPERFALAIEAKLKEKNT